MLNEDRQRAADIAEALKELDEELGFEPEPEPVLDDRLIQCFQFYPGMITYFEDGKIC